MILASKNPRMIIYAISGVSRNRVGPVLSPWIVSAPRNRDEVEFPGTPKDRSGTIELATTALLADSGAAMPSGTPVPNSRFGHLLEAWS